MAFPHRCRRATRRRSQELHRRPVFLGGQGSRVSALLVFAQLLVRAKQAFGASNRERGSAVRRKLREPRTDGFGDVVPVRHAAPTKLLAREVTSGRMDLRVIGHLGVSAWKWRAALRSHPSVRRR